MFGPNDVLPLDQIVLNTEAHPFPRFELGKLFSTGWQRKPRDANGNMIAEPPKETQRQVVGQKKEEAIIQTVQAADRGHAS